MDFENDIYISLANGNILNSWEKNLVQFLTTLLERLLNKKMRIAYSGEDRALQQNHTVLSGSCVYIILLNEDYIRSENSMAELESICNCLQGDKTRIFKVLKSEMPLNVQPESVRNYLSYDFFEKEVENPDEQSYYDLMIYEIERHYWTKLTDLSFDIYKQLSKETSEENKEIAIYLAETTTDQEKNLESIKRELKRLGYKIFPDTRLPSNQDDLKKAVFDYLKKTFMSIHLIGNNYGEIIQNSQYSIIDLQIRIASDYYEMINTDRKDPEGADFSRLIWINPDLKLSNEKQKQYIEQLKRDADILKGASLIQTPLEHFKSIILAEIKSKNQQPIHSFNKLNSGTRVYLIHESQSFDKISEISSFLANSGFEIIHSPLLSEEKNLLKKHRQNLIDCDAVLIYFDSSDEFWLKSKLNDLMKAPGFGRNRPFAAKAVLIDCEYDFLQEIFDKKGVFIIRSNQAFSPFLLDKFIDKIQMSFV